MKMRALEYFVTLAESRSINEAARKLYVAQPSLTKSLQLLEKELGSVLFQRTASGIALTEEGAKILPEARQVLAYYNGWLALSKKDELQCVDVFAHTSLSGFLFPGIMMQFKARYPELIINYTTVIRPEAYLSADTPHMKMALSICDEKAMAKNHHDAANYTRITLMDGEYGCLVSRSCKLAEKDHVTVEDLNDYFYVAPDLPDLQTLAQKHTFITPVVHEVFSAISPNRTVRVGTVPNVIELVKKYPQGYALSCYPACYRYDGIISGELVYLPFRGVSAGTHICLYYPRQAFREQRAIKDLVAEVRQAADRFLKEHGLHPAKGSAPDDGREKDVSPV